MCHWAVLEHRSLFVREHSPCFLCSYRSTPQSQTRHWFGSTVLLQGERPVQEECFPSGQLPRRGQLSMRAGPCRTHLHHPGATLVWPGWLDSGRAHHLARLGVSRAPAKILVLRGIGLKGQWSFDLPLLSMPCSLHFLATTKSGGSGPREGAAQRVGWGSKLGQDHKMGIVSPVERARHGCCDVASLPLGQLFSRSRGRWVCSPCTQPEAQRLPSERPPRFLDVAESLAGW